MIVNQSPNDAVITVEPTNEGIRIYGKWKNSFEFGVSEELFKIYDTIAYHLKKFSGLGVSSLTSKKNQTKPKKDEQSKIKGTMPKGWN